MAEPIYHNLTTAPICPSCSSLHPMALSPRNLRNPEIHELLEWHCPHCAHKGMTARRGVQLVFRAADEYVFAYAGSKETLTVTLSSAAIGLFKSHHIGADELAYRAAAWALLRGRTEGTVNLRAEELAQFYWYFYYAQPDIGHTSASKG